MRLEELRSKFERYVMNTYARFPVAVVKGKGCWVWDHEGRRYLDFTSGIGVLNLGHRHPAVLAAVRAQLARVIHTSNLFYTESQAELARLLVEHSFADKAFFCNTGTEANEAAIKLARRWGRANGGRYKIVAARGSFHGRTLGALSATGKEALREGFKPLVPGFKFVPFGDAAALERALDDEGVCAVMLEPIQGENGVVLPPEGYLRRVRSLCDQRGVLLVLDEIQVGLGRTGRLFAYEHEQAAPDVMTLAKALAGGVPAGCVLATEDVAVHFTPGSHGSTFGGNPLAMSAGCAAVRALADEALLGEVGRLGERFLRGLKRLASSHPSTVKEARGKGLILGLEMRSRGHLHTLFESCLERGLLFIPTADRVARFLPPLVVNKREIDWALGVLERALAEVA